MNKYFRSNRVASQYFGYDQIFESEKVDTLMERLADISLEIFKRMNFDLAPKKDRNLNKIRIKLSDIANSKTGIELLAKIKDYSEDNDLADGNFSDAKDLYIDSLDSLIEAIKSMSKLSKEKDSIFVKQAKAGAELLQGSLNEIAEKLAKAEAKSESENFEDAEKLNEKLGLVGYNGRVRRLRDRLTDLTSSATGKGTKDGYGKEWKRIFLELSQKLSALDTTRDGTGIKDKDILSQLEKDSNKYQTEFNKALMRASEKNLTDLENDVDLKDAYTDVIELVKKALDSFATAVAAQNTAEEIIKDSIEDRETKFSDDTFPIKNGNKDTDSKFDESDFIANLQQALMNGISTVNEFLKGKGGVDGKYGNATAAVIAALQKQSGNKDVNGELDRPLLDVLLASDFIAPVDRKKIVKSLDIMRETVANESLSTKLEKRLNKKVLSSADFFKLNESEKIRLDKDSLSDDINTYYEEFRDKSKKSNLDKKNINTADDAKELADAVAKTLRNHDMSIESDTFLKADGTLKSKYSVEFLKAWEYAIEKNYQGKTFFFFDEGVYAMGKESTSLNKPLNLPKWEKVNGDDSDDYADFVSNYKASFGKLAQLDRSVSIEMINEYFDTIDKLSQFIMKGIFDKIKKILTKEVPYIEIDDLKGPIAKALRNLIQENEADKGEADLGTEDLVAINNILVMLAGVFSHTDKGMINAAMWIKDNILTDEVLERINKDGYYTGWSYMKDGPILYLTQSGMKMRKSTVNNNKGKSVRGYYGSTLEDVLGEVPTNDKYKKLESHIKKPFLTVDKMAMHTKRMRAKDFEDLPKSGIHGTINVDLEDLKI